MPKLGWIDQLLYWTAMLLTGGGAFFLLLFPTYYRSELADANPLTLSWCDGEGVLHMLWLVFWLFLACILIASVFYPSRRPIVGRRDIRYGPPAYPRIYPLFMKGKQEWRSKKAIAADARGRRVIITTLIVSFLFCAALYPLSLFGRFELRSNGTIVAYDSHNREDAHYALRDIESVCLSTSSSGGGRYGSPTWYAKLSFQFSDGETCSFSLRSFAETWTESIRIAEELKETYGALLRIEGEKNLWRVVRDTTMSPEEERMLYQLYEASQ